jgi:hypothetical protein
LGDTRSSMRHVVARRVPLPESHSAPSVQGRGRPAHHREAVTYMLALPRVRGELCQRWQQATKLILDQADVAAVSHQVHLALFYDAQLDIGAIEGMNLPRGKYIGNRVGQPATDPSIS